MPFLTLTFPLEVAEVGMSGGLHSDPNTDVRRAISIFCHINYVKLFGSTLNMGR